MNEEYIKNNCVDMPKLQEWLKTKEQVAVFLDESWKIAMEENDYNIFYHAVADALKICDTKEVATETNMSVQAIYKIAKKQSGIKADNLFKILHYFNNKFQSAT